MLGGELVDEASGFGPVADQDDGAMVPPTGAGDGSSGERGKFGGDGLSHGIREGRIVSDQDRLGCFIMFRLGQQIDGDTARVVAGGGEDHDLGRAGDVVDADAAEHLTLGLGDISVARPDDPVHRLYGPGPVSQSGHRLGAADAVDFRHPGSVRGGEDEGIENAVGCRHTHGDAGDFGHAGGDGIHQDRGGVGGFASRHIKADRVERRPAHAKGHAGVVFEREVGGQLRSVERLNAIGGCVEGVALGGWHGGDGGGYFLRADAEFVWGESEAVEARGEVDERGVTSGTDFGDDRADGGIDGFGGFARLVEESGEIRTRKRRRWWKGGS